MTVTWTRDEIGEYHDGRGNSIHRVDQMWWLIRDGANRPRPEDHFRTLSAAKAAVQA